MSFSGNPKLLTAPRTTSVGPTAACDRAPMSLRPCGLTEITFIEATTDPEKGTTKTRSFSRAIRSTSPRGHSPLNLPVELTAPPEGLFGRGGRKVRLSVTGTGPCGSNHMVWTEAGRPPGSATHDLEIWAGRTPNKAFNDALEQSRRQMNAAGHIGATGATFLAQAGTLGIGVLLDGLSGIFRRSERMLTVSACGNPAEGTTSVARVPMRIYRREKFEFELTIPLTRTSDSFSSPSLGGMEAEAEDTSPACKLTIEDLPHGKQELEADLTKVRTLIRNVNNLRRLVAGTVADAPKVGFIFEGSLSGPEGTLTVAVQWRENDDETVGLWWEVGCALTLVTASFTVKYGAQMRFGEATVSLTVEGSLAMTLGEVAQQTGYEGIGAKGRTISAPVEGKLELKVDIKCEAQSWVGMRAGSKVPLKWDARFAVILPARGDGKGGVSLRLGDLELEQVVVSYTFFVGSAIHYTAEHTVTKQPYRLFKGSLD